MSEEKRHFQVGDLVELKSAGPVMVVDGPTQDKSGYVDCVWFSPDGNAHLFSFNEQTLRATLPPPTTDLAPFLAKRGGKKTR
jgi:uncharacterized protein YodC (DUF2158 family)